MDILNKLMTPDEKANAVVNAYNQPPQGESLAYINDAEKKILKNVGMTHMYLVKKAIME